MIRSEWKPERLFVSPSAPVHFLGNIPDGSTENYGPVGQAGLLFHPDSVSTLMSMSFRSFFFKTGRDFPGGPAVKTPRFQRRGRARVRSLVGELRSRMPRGAAKTQPTGQPWDLFISRVLLRGTCQALCESRPTPGHGSCMLAWAQSPLSYPRADAPCWLCKSVAIQELLTCRLYQDTSSKPPPLLPRAMPVAS